MASNSIRAIIFESHW